MPQTTITLLAGLQSVPEELHEAAAIDGASTFRRFLNVTWPAIRPVIVAITTLDLISNFNSFALVYVLTEGGPGGRTMLPALFVYFEAFSYNHWGYAAAMGNVLVVVVGVFLIIYLRANRGASPRVIASRHSAITRPLQYAALFAYLAFLGFPLLFLLVAAFKTQRELVAPDPTFLPRGLHWDNFRQAIDKTRMWTTARNSLLVATVTMLLTVVLALPAAYTMARFRTKFRGLATGWILLSQVFPFILIIIPLFIVLRDLGQIDELRGLVLVYTVWSLPFALWMLRGYIAGDPRRPRGGGAIDGASRLRVLRSIVFPLLAPGLVATALFTFIRLVERVLLRPRADPEPRPRDAAADAGPLRRLGGTGRSSASSPPGRCWPRSRA